MYQYTRILSLPPSALTPRRKHTQGSTSPQPCTGLVKRFLDLGVTPVGGEREARRDVLWLLDPEVVRDRRVGAREEVREAFDARLVGGLGGAPIIGGDQLCGDHIASGRAECTCMTTCRGRTIVKFDIRR